MNREEMIILLKNAAPALISVSFSEDMGYEFNAIVPDGVIYAEPGMLLNGSDDKWNLDDWHEIRLIENKQKLDSFLLDSNWRVTIWKDLSLDELEQWLESLD